MILFTTIVICNALLFYNRYPEMFILNTIITLLVMCTIEYCYRGIILNLRTDHDLLIGLCVPSKLKDRYKATKSIGNVVILYLSLITVVNLFKINSNATIPVMSVIALIAFVFQKVYAINAYIHSASNYCLDKERKKVVESVSYFLGASEREISSVALNKTVLIIILTIAMVGCFANYSELKGERLDVVVGSLIFLGSIYSVMVLILLTKGLKSNLLRSFVYNTSSKLVINARSIVLSFILFTGTITSIKVFELYNNFSELLTLELVIQTIYMYMLVTILVVLCNFKKTGVSEVLEEARERGDTIQ